MHIIFVVSYKLFCDAGDLVTEKMINRNSTRIPLLWKIILFIEIIVWIPLPFLGFDSHHDGLILTTVNLIQDAIRNGGEWPFNQYGPIWAMPFVLGTFPFPSEWTFTIIRFMTVGFYLLTGFFVYRCAKIISSERTAFVSVLVFFLSQPFLTDYGSALVPWPSAVIMPLISLATLLVFQIHIGTTTKSQEVFYSIVISVLVSGIFFSRAQIGFLLFFALLLLLFFNNQILALVALSIGFLASTLLIFFFLDNRGWLSDALNDEFVFGSLYLRGDTSTYPIPIFTFMGAAAFLFFLNFGKNALNFVVRKYSLKMVTYIFIGSLLVIFITSYAILNSRSTDLLAILVIISRRFWISYFLAVIIYSLFGQLRQTYEAYKSRGLQDIRLQLRNILVLLSFVGEIQVFPLFDQMHFWWGSVPAVILVVIVTKERLVDGVIPSVLINRVVSIFLVVTTVLSVIPLVSQFSKTFSRYPNEISRSLWVAPSAASEARELQEFFSFNIADGSSVLNLCANADVFFVAKKFSSSSRIFLLWPYITDIKEMRNSLENSNPDFVVTCSLSRIVSLQNSSEDVQKQILEKSLINPQEIALLEFSPELIWRIWRSSTG